jgi:hypothetical protein
MAKSYAKPDCVFYSRSYPAIEQKQAAVWQKIISTAARGWSSFGMLIFVVITPAI